MSGNFNRKYFAVILNPDMTYDKDTFCTEIVGPFNCQDELKELKVANNWNVPIDDSTEE